MMQGQEKKRAFTNMVPMKAKKSKKDEANGTSGPSLMWHYQQQYFPPSSRSIGSFHITSSPPTASSSKEKVGLHVPPVIQPPKLSSMLEAFVGHAPLPSSPIAIPPAFSHSAPSNFVHFGQEEQARWEDDGSAQQMILQQNSKQPPTLSPMGFFELLEQPSVKQRKSYHNETRYLIPNPLHIVPREARPGERLPDISEGFVKVELVNEDGTPIAAQQNSIMQTAEGTYVQPLDHTHGAKFSIKICEASDGNFFALLFTIWYKLNGQSCEDKILSRPFQVVTGAKRIRNVEPAVYGLKACCGLHDRPTEVWVKGSRFASQVVVYFGSKQAIIKEREENLLVVIAPPRLDLTETTPVNVQVLNKFNNNKLITAEKQPMFTYVVLPKNT